MCIWLILVITLHITEAYLPGNARRVNSCPEPNNLTAWKIAARKLNCSEYIEANIQKGNLYHCLPSNFLNETIEFCGGSAAIDKGECPVYNYQNGATVPTGRSCEKFTSGCPEPQIPPYHSLQFYKYSECFNINRIDRCYHAEPDCSKVEHRRKTTSLPHINRSSDSSVSGSASSVPGYGTTPTTRSNTDLSSNSNLPVWTVILLTILDLAVFVLVVILIIVIRRRKKEKTELKTELPVVEYNKRKTEDDVNIALLDDAKPCSEEHSKEKFVGLNKRKAQDDVIIALLDDAKPCSEEHYKEKCDDLEDKKGDHEKEPNKDNDGTIKESQIHDPKSRKLDNAYAIALQEDPIYTDEEDERWDVLEYNNFYCDLCDEIIKRDLIERFKIRLYDHTDKTTPTDDIQLEQETQILLQHMAFTTTTAEMQSRRLVREMSEICNETSEINATLLFYAYHSR
ncbi:uncharacterized protein LOC125650423 isoform X2 [Ostrea edulis]|nr:uncharacterized protein LOC125650423 isoform X2 [Ostrea edulis]XP_056021828.1 uncharacterized protein LOC125650423 isoform X2 [Ostrea edulis]XP_056021829.1 uncharacterized protein LOC125650423 isoform X2 [Ostrea edulis]